MKMSPESFNKILSNIGLPEERMGFSVRRGSSTGKMEFIVTDSALLEGIYPRINFRATVDPYWRSPMDKSNG